MPNSFEVQAEYFQKARDMLRAEQIVTDPNLPFEHQRFSTELILPAVKAWCVSLIEERSDSETALEEAVDALVVATVLETTGMVLGLMCSAPDIGYAEHSLEIANRIVHGYDPTPLKEVAE